MEIIMKKLLTLIATLTLFMSCAQFEEVQSNVIVDQKIRPFAIQLEKAEAAPGDTVHVELFMYDANKQYTLNWEVALNYTIDNYGEQPTPSHFVPMDSLIINSQTSGNNLSFDFIVPNNENNPLLISSLTPDVILAPSAMDQNQKNLLISLGADVTAGLTKTDAITLLDGLPQLPNELSPIVDEFLSLITVRATIAAPSFDLTIDKNLTIRYSNRLAAGSIISSVNKSPVIDSIAIISVEKGDLENPHEIGNYASDTLWLSNIERDTINIQSDKSYFFLASNGLPQTYRSPLTSATKTEDLFYSWHFTNEDAVDASWEDLIELIEYGAEEGLDVIKLDPPSNHDMHNFLLHIVVADWRPEWAMRASQGIDVIEISAYFNYVD